MTQQFDKSSNTDAANDEAAIAFLEISAGAAIASLIPFKILVQHLIASGVINRDAFAKDLEAGLNTNLYHGETRAMLDPIWSSLKKELGHG